MKNIIPKIILLSLLSTYSQAQNIENNNNPVVKLMEGIKKVNNGLNLFQKNDTIIAENKIIPKIIKNGSEEFTYFINNDTLLRLKVFINRNEYVQRYQYDYEKGKLYFIELTQINKYPKENTLTIKGNCCTNGELIFQGFSRNTKRSKQILKLEKKALQQLK